MSTQKPVVRARIWRIVPLAAVAALAFLPQAALAQPTQAPTGPIVSGDRPTKCVDDLGNSAKNNTPVVISDCNGSPEQTWTIAADGSIQINGKCLDIYRQQKTDRTMIQIWTCTGGTNQQWQAVNDTLVNPHSGKCLDVPKYDFTNGTQLDLYTCNGQRNQQWVVPADGPSSR